MRGLSGPAMSDAAAPSIMIAQSGARMIAVKLPL